MCYFLFSKHPALLPQPRHKPVFRFFAGSFSGEWLLRLFFALFPLRTHVWLLLKAPRLFRTHLSGSTRLLHLSLQRRVRPDVLIKAGVFYPEPCTKGCQRFVSL